MADEFDSFGALLRAALGAKLSPADTFLRLFAEQMVFEFPYAPEGFPHRLLGRDQLAEHLGRLGPMLEFDRFELEAHHDCGNVSVLEFSCTGRGVDTGAAYDQRYISVVTIRDGRIAQYKDYWNPLVVLAALGGTASDPAHAGESATHG